MGNATAINYRINPAFFIKYKGFNEQSEKERKEQLNEKDRGQIKEVTGQNKLEFKDIKGFKK